MSIEQEIQDLTQSTTDLLNAVNTKKVTLDNSVSQAQTAVTDATSQVALAAAEKVGAQTARDEAETHKNNAYTYSQSAASAVAYQDLTAIAQTKAENAVDVFVYDTSKDSDGGAWRHRTQHTSWYNETLNTATRGSRKEFPAVAVIVAEAGKVTIYDGDDPTLPMWMVFNSGNGTTTGTMMSFDPDIESVYMLNGVLCAGIQTTLAGLTRINFISEEAFRHRTTNLSYPISGAGGLTIATRNSQYIYNATNDGSIINTIVNDVAMTVLPDAPIDQATGLPIPTIAVATDGGVSVIKDDGTVVDFNQNASLSYVSFLNDNKILTLQTTSGGYAYVYPDPSNINQDGVSYIQFLHWSTTTNYPSVVGQFWQGNLIKDVIGTPYGMTKLEGNPYDMGCDITSTYNTGWMNGDIKLATLSDTDDTDLVGSELVTNGTFDTDVSGWTVTASGAFTYSAGTGILEQVSGTNANVSQTITTVVGQRYVVSASVSGTSCRLLIGTSQNEGNLFAGPFTTGVLIGDFVATTTTTYIHIQSAATVAGLQSTIDNISVRLAEPDRSVNNNGLQVFGTVQKNPVATGADLVAYSGVSGGYLEQPYNSDLDFGTGDFCMMGWFNTTDSYGMILDRNSPSGSSFGGFSVGTYPRSVNGLDFSVQNNFTLSSTVAVDTGSWVNFVCLRRSGIVEMWINGKLDNTLASATDINSGSANPITKFGLRYDGAQSLQGSLALLRISGTAPTAEQIKKIYEDEKVLFQENAKATLHGTSDAVTALAYDEDTGLLSVGTSSGRSDFRGLRRVNNTTDAVGVAISASNGLIVEE